MECAAIDDVPSQVFGVITSRLADRASDIAGFVTTKYSFEEWCNWEAYSACRAISGWTVRPKPGYRSLSAATCKDLGDLLVTDTRSSVQVLVEIGLVHDGTGDKDRRFNNFPNS